MSEDLKPVLARLFAISEIKDDEIFMSKLRKFQADFPDLKIDVLKDPSADRALLPVVMKAFMGGLESENKL